MSRKIVSLFLVFAMLCSSCFAEEDGSSLPQSLCDSVYASLVSETDSQYYVSDVQTVYISQEYLEEFAFNSRVNRYFGFTLAELDKMFSGARYSFTLGADGQTEVTEFVVLEDDTLDQIIRNIAIGTGVILICFTVCVLTEGTGLHAVHMMFVCAAREATFLAGTGTVFGGMLRGGITLAETGNIEEAIKSAALGASEGYKWGAIIGTVKGSAEEVIGLHGASLNGLTMNEAAQIQHETGLPLNFIRYMHSMDEYNLYKSYGLTHENLNGLQMYTQEIDLWTPDENGITNADLIRQGLSPKDAEGIPYELHHIGQSPDSPIAILTRDQHRQGEAYSILHSNVGMSESQIDREIFEEEKKKIWDAYLTMRMNLAA